MKIVTQAAIAANAQRGGGAQVVPMRPGVALQADPRVEQLVAKVTELSGQLAQVVKAHNATVEELTKLKAAHNQVARGASSLAKHFQGFAAASQIQYTPAVVQRSAPPAQASAPAAQRGPPPAAQTVINATPAQPAARGARQQQQERDAEVFYGKGDAAFYEGGENDE